MEATSHRFGEVAGGATAECAAVFCCPCAVLNLAVLALVKLPAGLFKKAWRKVKRKERNRSKLVQGKQNVSPYDDSDTEDSCMASSNGELLNLKHNVNVLIMDQEQDQTCASTEKIWEDVVGKSHVGFWRNHSLHSRGPGSGSEAPSKENKSSEQSI